jgi:hypothetical protein
MQRPASTTGGAGASNPLRFVFPIALAMLCATSCSSEERVRISGARPGEEDYVNQQPPYAAEFCLPKSYSDGNFIWERDAGVVRIKFLHPSLAPGGRDRSAPGFVALHIWPGPEDGRRFDYSRGGRPTEGDPVPHPYMNPPALAVQYTGGIEVSSSVFPSFSNDYTVVPTDAEWRRRVRIWCWRYSTSPEDWCDTSFQTSRGFAVHVGSHAETTYDLPSLMASVETLVERFLAACDVEAQR